VPGPNREGPWSTSSLLAAPFLGGLSRSPQAFSRWRPGAWSRLSTGRQEPVRNKVPARPGKVRHFPRSGRARGFLSLFSTATGSRVPQAIRRPAFSAAATAMPSRPTRRPPAMRPRSSSTVPAGNARRSGLQRTRASVLSRRSTGVCRPARRATSSFSSSARTSSPEAAFGSVRCGVYGPVPRQRISGSAARSIGSRRLGFGRGRWQASSNFRAAKRRPRRS
jgi:hypothetical protein